MQLLGAAAPRLRSGHCEFYLRASRHLSIASNHWRIVPESGSATASRSEMIVQVRSRTPRARIVQLNVGRLHFGFAESFRKRIMYATWPSWSGTGNEVSGRHAVITV